MGDVQVVIVLSAVAILAVLVVVLLAVTRQLNHTRVVLARLNAELERQVTDRTESLNHANALLRAEIGERKQLEKELHRRATTDELTGVANRRHFQEVIDGEIKRSIRHGHPLSVALIDVDRLKEINDSYGHTAGDQALLTLAQLCLGEIREIDTFARFGGDEFAMLLPDADCDEAEQVLHRVRRALSRAPVDVGVRRIPLTVSVGIACLTEHRESAEMLIDRADVALYRAKSEGRDRVVLAQRLSPSSES